MELCKHCSALDIDRLPPSINPRTDDFVLGTLRDVFDGRASGCPFCSLLITHFLGFVDCEKYLTREAPTREFEDAVLRLRRRVRESKRVSGRIHPTKLGGIEFVGPGNLSFDIPLYAKAGSPASLDGSVVASDLCMPLDPEALNPARFATKWLGICLEQHDKCRRSFAGDEVDDQPKAVAPSRLLHVRPVRAEDRGAENGSPAVVVRLVETTKKSEFTARYAALSHCWGPPEKRRPCTLRDNVAAHKEEVPWSKLSQTFRDACSLCAYLDVEYLWIDSLCIIQDDKADWETEAAIMGRAYDEALLVIAASAATDSSQGLFGVRLRDDFVQLPHKAQPHSGVYAYKSRSPGYFVDNGPLNTRAWVLQEYILARRTIHFTQWGAVWVCSRDPAMAVSEYGGGVHHIPYTWANVVRDYSRRTLTFKSDKLIAVQGLAASWGKREGKTPHYGLFLEDMPYCLRWLWSGHGDEKLLRDVEGAPSWSWASVTGRVDFIMSENEEAASSTSVACGRVRPSDQFGRLGTLVFEASRIKAIDEVVGPFDCLPSYIEDLRAIDPASPPVRPSWCNHSNHYDHFFLLTDRSLGHVGWCAFDGTMVPSGPVSCMPLVKEAVSPWYMPPVDTAEPLYLWCLIVIEATTIGEATTSYERVGWGSILLPSWVEAQTRQDIYLG